MLSRMFPSHGLPLVCALLLVATPVVVLADAPAGSPPSPQSPTAGPSSTAPAADAEPSAATRSESIIARILAGITRVGPGAATMSRESRDLILSNLAILSRSARAVPANDSGGMGFRLYGIRRGSVLAALGLLNGDLLKSINGRPTTTPQEVLAAYSGLRGASSWALSINRRGTEMTLVVRVVDGAPSGATPPATTTPTSSSRPSAP
jgi:hypothetical protein